MQNTAWPRIVKVVQLVLEQSWYVGKPQFQLNYGDYPCSQALPSFPSLALEKRGEVPGIISYVSDIEGREKALKGTGTWSWIKLVCRKLGCITFPTKSYWIFAITNYYWRHLALVWDNTNFTTLHSRVIVASCSVEYKYKLPPPDHSLTEFVRVCWPSPGHTVATSSGFRWGIHRFTIKCTSMCHEAHPELYLWSYMPSSLCGWCALSS